MLHLDNFIYRDYAAWKIENLEIINKFMENDNPIYKRMEPIYLVLNHIYDLACLDEEVDEDYETVFEVGFNYLHSQFEVIKIYFQSLFQSNCDDFHQYSESVLYLLYIYDVRNDLENNGYDVDFPELDALETNIENMIMERREDFLYFESQMKEVFDNIFANLSFEYIGIVEVFTEIAFTLGIYDDDEIILGTDI